MKQLLDTMSVRIFLIAVVGILLTAAIVSTLGEHDSRENEKHLRDQFAFERIENIERILDATVPEKRIEILDVFKRNGSHVTIGVSPPPDSQPPAELAHLHQRLVPDVAVTLTRAPASHCVPRRGGRLPPPPGMPPPRDWSPPEDRHPGECLAIYTRLEDHTPVLIEMHYGGRRRPPPQPWLGGPGNLPLAILLAFIGLISIVWAVATVATKPLRKLADAALHLADNIEHPPLPEDKGPTEVRHAAQAFNQMQQSLLKHIQERSFILGAISHDLQTPLTRLRLRLEKVKDAPLKQALINDLTATQDMVREGLDFARLCGEQIPQTTLDLAALATAICDDYADSGHPIGLSLPDGPVMMTGSPHLLTRCLNNLLNNALSYASAPTLSIVCEKDHLFCTVADEGPGIPASELQHVLEPYRRVEDSRSRQTGGSGLGLSIARMIVEKHGGQLHLQNRPLPAHGLIVTLKLPRQLATDKRATG